MNPYLSAIRCGLISLSFSLLMTLLALSPILFFPVTLPFLFSYAFHTSKQYAQEKSWYQSFLMGGMLVITILTMPFIWISIASFYALKNMVYNFTWGIRTGASLSNLEIFLVFEQEVDRANTTQILQRLYVFYCHAFYQPKKITSILQEIRFLILLNQSFVIFSLEMLFDPAQANSNNILKLKASLAKAFKFMHRHPDDSFFAHSYTEISQLFATNQPLLTVEELINLNTLPTQSIDDEAYAPLTLNELLKRYEALLHLQDNICPILNAKPNKPLLLTKQYKKDGVWLNVPYYSLIFDEDSFKRWYNINPVLDKLMFTKPIIKNIPRTERLNQPLPYKNYETRFQYHSFTEKSINQELNELILFLRKYHTQELIHQQTRILTHESNTSHGFKSHSLSTVPISTSIPFFSVITSSNEIIEQGDVREKNIYDKIQPF